MIDEKRLLDVLKYLHLSKEVAKELNTSERSLRRAINKYNNSFAFHETVIISNRDGYFVTTDSDEIKRFALARIKHALSELNNGKDMLDEVGYKAQLSFLDDAARLTDLYIKFRGE